MSRPSIAVFDEFFREPDEVLEEIVAGPFEDIKNPVDGVVYPGINSNIPVGVREIIDHRLHMILGRDIEINTQFARFTGKTISEAPHKIHSDRIMGQYSMHIYLSKEWPDGAGTSFWSHPTEGRSHSDTTSVDVIRRDQNDISKWHQEGIVYGRFNRALIHRAEFWHLAEPIGGWGTSPRDGRLVLTTFFSEVKR